ncbi:MAG: DUF1549 domain-containing protein [Rhodopirellula sp.]|nr:DUF1549 domain-containing protein [Rhodopirellula sp.]
MKLSVFRILISVAGIVGWAGSPPSATAADPAIVFNRDIRPLLSENCYRCHGPDAGQRQADLRLDTAEGAVADLGGYRAIVPGKPEESEAYVRIAEPDESMRMPPADSGRQLSADQVALIGRWIRQGAEWQGHWSFLPLHRPSPPQAADSSRINNAIDAFIVHRLQAEGLEHCSEADKATLIRRVTLDLTGLPPLW